MGSGGADPLAVAPASGPALRPKRLLHLLWTIPLAIAVSALPWIYGAINICGISGCTGGGFGVSYGAEIENWICAAIIAAAFAAAIAPIAWIRPWWIHVGIGLGIGIAIGGVLIAGWLGAKYQYYPAGIDCYPAYSYSQCEYGF